MRRNPFAIWAVWYNRRPFVAEVVTVTAAVGTIILTYNATLPPLDKRDTVVHLITYALGAGVVSGAIGRLGAYLRRRGPAPRQPGDA